MAMGRITQKDLDLIRVEAEAITSTDDKYFRMEKLHKYIEGIEEQLEAAERENNAKERARLLELKRYAQEIRQYIMKRPVGPKRYGLFIEYPEGYEG